MNIPHGLKTEVLESNQTVRNSHRSNTELMEATMRTFACQTPQTHNISVITPRHYPIVTNKESAIPVKQYILNPLIPPHNVQKLVPRRLTVRRETAPVVPVSSERQERIFNLNQAKEVMRNLVNDSSGTNPVIVKRRHYHTKEITSSPATFLDRALGHIDTKSYITSRRTTALI